MSWRLPRRSGSMTCMDAVWIRHYTAASALGLGREATRAALEEGRCALAPCSFESARLTTWVGEVAGVDEVQLPAALAAYNCRNNRLAQLGLSQDGFTELARERIAHWGAARVGVFMGTSTSGVLETEIAYRQRDASAGRLPPGFEYRRAHNAFALTDYVRSVLGATGPAVTICTACSSSAKVFAAAARMLDAGLIDAAVVGGVDSLCLTTLYGFHSLQLTASGPCRRFRRYQCEPEPRPSQSRGPERSRFLHRRARDRQQPAWFSVKLQSLLKGYRISHSFLIDERAQICPQLRERAVDDLGRGSRRRR